MSGIKIAKANGTLLVEWQLLRIAIPLTEITEVAPNETYRGSGRTAVRIGLPAGTTDRVAIRTRTKDYIIYTSDGRAVSEQINGYMLRHQ
ncbi:hypothetical protein [Paenibacillus tepidiphilus]|uniref:SunI/YnzG family protein n=1 Tax=Paenibacillus tepidiphilus TaxID=2608683 RepID=UPI00123BEDCE|nr:hypothetical protein [Paenibacillus tepidiphilus]